MRRRDVLRVLAGAATMAPWAAAAQSDGRTYRLAALSPLGVANMAATSFNASIVIGKLMESGYALDRNLIFQPYGADMEVSRLPRLAREIAASKFDAVFVVGYPAAAAMKGTGVPTVVGSGVGDPVAAGLVASLAHPGGNLTGISDNAETLSTKRLSLLKLAVPGIRKVAMLWNKNDLAMTLRYKASADAARALGVTVQPLGVGEPDDFADTFAAMDREPPDAILMVSDALTLLNRERVFDYAAAHRLPAIFEADRLARAGGLMSYGADPKESFGRAASLIERIFKGASPAELPFEEPTRYLFVINLKTAKSIGLEIPSTVLALADEVIE